MNVVPTSRPYRQSARALSAQATADRILQAFLDSLAVRPFADITLDEISAAAHVSRQTVARRFESKMGLMRAAGEAIGALVRKTRTPAGTQEPAEAVAALLRDYELTGDLVVKVLSEEDRSPELTEVLDKGREGHMEWVRESFSRKLGSLEPVLREQRIVQLAAITDVWVWRVLRRDQKRSEEEVRRLITDLVLHLL